MKKVIINFVLVLVCTSLFAQNNKEGFKILPTFKVTVDGDLGEWKQQFNVLDRDSSWSFAITNDAEFLYIAVAIKDAVLQQDATRHGMSVNINPQAKKKDAATLLFPVPDSETLRAMANDENLPKMNVREELIKRSRGYGVKGFDLIVDGRLSFDNTYGIQATAKLINEDLLVYESKIPLKYVAVKDMSKNVAIQIMINNRFAQLQKALKNRPSPNRGIYGNYTPTLKNPYKMKTEIWWIGRLNEN